MSILKTIGRTPIVKLNRLAAAGVLDDPHPRPERATRLDYGEARAIDEEEAREMARRLAREEGIFAGVSSGLNVAAAIQLATELGPGRSVVTVAVDTGLKYLAGDLFN
jgi:cysteine synthase